MDQELQKPEEQLDQPSVPQEPVEATKPIETKLETQNGETITLTKDQFEAIIEKLNRLEKGGVRKPKKVNDRIAVVRVVEGKLFSGYEKKPWTVNFGRHDEYMLCKARFVGKDGTPEVKEINYLQFIREAPTAKVKILSRKDTTIVESQGEQQMRDPETDRVLSGQSMEIEVTSVESEFTIEILDGDLEGTTFVVNDEALNV